MQGTGSEVIETSAEGQNSMEIRRRVRKRSSQMSVDEGVDKKPNRAYLDRFVLCGIAALCEEAEFCIVLYEIRGSLHCLIDHRCGTDTKNVHVPTMVYMRICWNRSGVTVGEGSEEIDAAAQGILGI